MDNNYFNDYSSLDFGFNTISNLGIGDELLRNEIDILREHGYSEDEILLILIGERCRPEPKEQVKTKNLKYNFGGSTR